ncbi:MAG TPA: hypothetical protein VMR98_02550 [Candidatus Polarisedimenticolaceae bacterium]|nr:hypothetical protein [Candidatus Polarisedimenticolaceae bacterium]
MTTQPTPKSFAIDQKIAPLANQYYVYELNEAGGKGQLLAFAHQKRFAFKEKFTFYTDESKQQVAFEVQARKVLDFGARYDVRDAQGEVLGVLGKAFGASFLRSTWHIFDPNDETTPQVVVRERSQALAIVRRLWEFIPIVGEIPFFIKYHFEFIDPTTQAVHGGYEKVTTLRDHYRLNADAELLGKAQWRVLVSLGIMMDALQGR